jgi:uncharacterized protein YbjT (DUF2867 family)
MFYNGKMRSGCLILVLVASIIIGSEAGRRVVVTGAAGRTGSIVLQKLTQLKLFAPVGLVKSTSDVSRLAKKTGVSSNILVADTTDAKRIEEAFQGADSVVLCTSAVPKIKWLSLIKVFIWKLFGKKAQPEFYFTGGNDPRSVDWLGAKNQIDAAVKAGVKHFVFLSSMGGTNPDHFLNSLGKTKDDPNSGRILQWKRRAEEYLIKSGVPYTILHAGGLTDKPGGHGTIIMDVDDKLLQGTVRTIPREDVAEVIVAALQVGAPAQNRSIDIVCLSSGESAKTAPSRDWNALYAQPGDCQYATVGEDITDLEN